MSNDTLARQKARAVGKITTGLLLNDPSETELRVINELSDATIKRRIRTLYIPADSGLIKKVEGVHPESLLEFHEGWIEFFKKFGIEIDLANFPLKPYSEGWDWSIINPKPESFFHGWEIAKQAMLAVHEYITVKNIVDVYPHEPVVSVRPLVEAREEFPNISTRQSIQHGIKGTTFNQYCLLASRIWVDKKIHLDDKSVTICPGSRSGDGCLVFADWGGGRFRVDNLCLDDAYDFFSVRSAV